MSWLTRESKGRLKIGYLRLRHVFWCNHINITGPSHFIRNIQYGQARDGVRTYSFITEDISNEL